MDNRFHRHQGNGATSPHTIHDFAARIFWKFARSVGREAALHASVQSQGFGPILAPQMFDYLVKIARENSDGLYGSTHQFFSLVALEIFNSRLRGEMLLGTIKADDAKHGRSLDVGRDDLRGFSAAFAPIDTSVNSGNVPKFGRLCIRAPLPSVIFCPAEPPARLLRVDDTKAALGFHMPIFLAVSGTSKISEGLWMAYGDFFVPAQTQAISERWSNIIPNSTTFCDNVTISCGENDVARIVVTWRTTRS